MHLLRSFHMWSGEQDLMQYEGRENWYAAKFSADDAPDWNPASFVQADQLAPGLRNVVLRCEISRERVPLRNAYKHANQRASVRVNGGVEFSLTGGLCCGLDSCQAHRALLVMSMLWLRLPTRLLHSQQSCG